MVAVGAADNADRHHAWTPLVYCVPLLIIAEDSFNLYGLRNEITYDFRQCLDTILGDAPGGCTAR